MLSCAVLLGTALTGILPASGEGPGWGPQQEVPPFDAVHQSPRSAMFPDGTLVTVWEHDQTGSEDELTTIFRSTRPPGGEWSMPEEFPVDGVRSLEGVAGRADGDLLVSISYESAPAGTEHRVSRWSAAGAVDDTGVTNTQDAYTLGSDNTGDVIADRLGGKGAGKKSHHVLTYDNGDRSWQLPKLGADPRDVFVPGPRDSVWMAGYDASRSTLLVRRWKPGMSKWKNEWSRSYPGRHRRPLVVGLDLAVSDAGGAILAFKERRIGRTGDTLRAVHRTGKSGWAKPTMLQRIAADKRLTISAPVVAAAGDYSEVAWTSSASRLTGKREIRVAQMTRGSREVRLLAKVTSLEGFEDLSLDVDCARRRRPPGHLPVAPGKPPPARGIPGVPR